MNEPTGDPFAYDRFLEEAERKQAENTRRFSELSKEYYWKGFSNGFWIGALLIAALVTAGLILLSS